MNNSSLFDETTFYHQFTKDLLRCSSEVVVESPFITSERMSTLFPYFKILVEKGVRVYVFTRDPREHNELMEEQSEVEIQRFEKLGVQVLLCTGNHHRKLALLDREIIWEGSLNILSQGRSREIMRRIEDEELADDMFEFLKYSKFL